MRRNSFSIATSPMIIEEFDCSTDSHCISASGGTVVSAMREVGSKRISPACVAIVVALASPFIAARATSGRENPSVRSPTWAPPPYASNRKLGRQRTGRPLLPDDRQRQQPSCRTALRGGFDLRQQQF